jgi:hypothetical protein
MDQFWMFLEPSFEIGGDGGLDDANFRQDGPNVGGLEALIHALAHATCQDDFAVGNERYGILVLIRWGFSVILDKVDLLVSVPVFMSVPVPVPMSVPMTLLLVPHLLRDDGTIFRRHDHIVLCAAKMITDSGAIIGDYSNLHTRVFPFILLMALSVQR